MQEIIVAVIGCGTIANNAHFPAISKAEHVRIKYAVDIIPERAQAAKAKYGAETAETDYKVALADKEVNVVFVLTPNYLHYQMTMDALRAGKHVLCEKPIALDYKTSCEMAAEAEKQGKILSIGVCNRYHKTVNMIRKLVQNGRLGELYHVYCSFRSYRNIPGLGGPFTTKALSGGGVLIDWGIHFFDLILYIMGGAKIKSVTADTYNKLGKNIKDYNYIGMWAGPPVLDGVCDVEEMVCGYIRTDKASVSFNGAWAQNINKEEMYIDFLGDKGGVRMNYGGTFTLYTDENRVLQTIEPSYEIPNMYEEEDRAFFESVRTGKRNRSYIAEVLESEKLLDALYESARRKQEVKF